MTNNDKVVVFTSMYYKPHVGGIESSLDALAQIGIDKNYRVLLVCSDNSFNAERLPFYEKSSDVEIFRFKNYQPKISVFKIFSPMINSLRCYRLAKKLQKDIPAETKVLTRHYITGFGFHLAGYKNMSYLIPGIVAEQDTFYLKDKKETGLKNKIIINIIIPQNIWLQKKTVAAMKKNLVFSELMQKECLKNFKVLPFIVKPGVDRHRFYLRNRSQARQNMGIPSDTFIALCIGRITQHKGFTYAIEALQLINHVNIKLLIVGDGPEKENLQAMAIELRVQHLVDFYDKTSSPENFYAVADVFLMTSVHETFGQTIIESMATSLPVIAFDSKEVATASNEIISNGQTGFIIPFSSHDLADCLSRCYTQPDMLTAMGKNCLKEMEDRYSWNRLFNYIFIEN